MNIKSLMLSSKVFGFGIYCIVAGLIGIIFVVFSLSPTYTDLLKINGVLNSIKEVKGKMNMVLQTDRGSLNVHADNSITEIISKSFVQKGDTVTMWIVKDNLWRDFYWMWQLERNG